MMILLINLLMISGAITLILANVLLWILILNLIIKQGDIIKLWLKKQF